MGFTFKQRNNREYVFSSILYFIEYDKETQLMKVGFNDGMIGYFKNVPDYLFQQFKFAESKGHFFYEHIYNAGYKSSIKYM